MKRKIKFLLLRLARITPYVPFLNRISGLSRSSIDFGNAILINCCIKVSGKGNRISFADGIYRDCHFKVRGNNNMILLGSNVHGKDMDVWIEDNKNALVVGPKTSFAGKIHLACTEGRKIEIGADCLFSSEIVIRTGDSHSILDSEGRRINQAQDVIIGDHVWMTHRAMVTKGAKIPSHCIVGTGAIVTKSFEETNTVLAGVPAKITKRNVDWDARRL